MLRALEVERQEGIYGNLAALVAHYAQKAKQAVHLVDLERHFPAWEGKTNPFLSIEQLTFDRVRHLITPQLQKLCDEERGDPVMPIVLDAWGVDRRGAPTRSLSLSQRAGRLRDADLNSVLPEPPGSPHLIVDILGLGASFRDAAVMGRLLPVFATLREISSLPFLHDADLSYCETLSFQSGYYWPRDAEFNANKFLEPFQMVAGFDGFCAAFVDVVERFAREDGLLPLDVVTKYFSVLKKSWTQEVLEKNNTDSRAKSIRIGAAFCVGYNIRSLLTSKSKQIRIPAVLPHQKLVMHGAMISRFRCARLNELPPLARQGLASGLVAGEEFDAALRARYFIDALESPLADAPNWNQWGLDAFHCSSQAFADAPARNRAQKAAGAEIISAMTRFYAGLHSSSSGQFTVALQAYMADQQLESPCPEAKSFDEISLAVDFGLWAAVTDFEWKEAPTARLAKPGRGASQMGGEESVLSNARPIPDADGQRLLILGQRLDPAEFPAIELPHKNRATLGFDRCWGEVRERSQLPARLFTGDLDPTSFRATPEGWEATYRGGELFSLQLSLRGPSIWIEEKFDGQLVISGCFPARLKGAEILKAYVREATIYDQHLKAYYETTYNAVYLPLQSKKELGLVSYFPDGVFQTLMLFLPFSGAAFEGLCDAFGELEGKDVCVSGALELKTLIINYREGRCAEIPMKEVDQLAWSLERGFLPVAIPVWEGKPGNRALTSRSLCYFLRVTFPMRDGPEILGCLNRYGLVAAAGESAQQLGFIVHALEAEHVQHVSGYSKDESRRFYLHFKDAEEKPADASRNEVRFVAKSFSELSARLSQVLRAFEAKQADLHRAIWSHG